jgi:two-component system, NarL family, response regulator NreC
VQKVIVLDASEVFRMGLRTVLSRDGSDLEVVDDAGSADPERIAGLRPDLVLTDLCIRPSNAAGLIARLKRRDPSIRVVAMSHQASGAAVRQIVDAGGCGFLLKTMPAQALVAAVHRVLKGETVLAVPAAALGRARGRQTDGRGAKLESLSVREREVFDLVVWGCSNKEIAAQLSISVKTVQSHRGHINGKLDLCSSADFVRLAALEGALDCLRGPETPLDPSPRRRPV